ncbi:MAG: divalent metal cation transporter [Planctomycetota bacterium]
MSDDPAMQGPEGIEGTEGTEGIGGIDDLRRGLRVGTAADEAQLAAEARELEALDAAPALTRWASFLRRGGPGYLQAAMTLGGGTAVSAIFAGRLFGYQLLWVAPLAMLLGIVMLGALAHQTLSTGLRPLDAMRRYAGAPVAWGWALSALLASIIWHFPQYSLAGGALSDALAVGGLTLPPLGSAFIVLGFAVWMSLMYGRGGRALRLYETSVKALVWAVVAAFAVVVIASAGRTDWGTVGRGFIPSLPEARGGTQSLTLIVAGLASAVGVNMVFLYPYSLRARGWGRAHRKLARFDLFAGMLLPYTLATSLVVIATANTIPWDPTSGEAAKLQAIDAARSIGSVLGATEGRLVFDVGLLAMALSTITLHMVCAGFVVMELTGAAFGSARWRLGTLLPAVGVLGPLVGQDLLFWLAIPTSIVCGLFLPLAYYGITRLQASRAYLGEDQPRGARGGAILAAMVLITGFLTFMFVRDLRTQGPSYLQKIRGQEAPK